MTKSLQSAAKQRIVIGKLGAPHGIKGDLKVIVLTDFPECFRDFKKVYVGDELLEIAEVKYQHKQILIRFVKYSVREEAAKLTGREITVEREELAPLAEGVYYTFEIIGLEAKNEAGEVIGRVKDIFPTGSNDVYVIAAEGKDDLLLPAIKDVILKIDIEGGYIVVRPQEEY